MPRPAPNAQRGSRERRLIAQEAARLIREGGIHDPEQFDRLIFQFAETLPGLAFWGMFPSVIVGVVTTTWIGAAQTRSWWKTLALLPVYFLVWWLQLPGVSAWDPVGAVDWWID